MSDATSRRSVPRVRRAWAAGRRAALSVALALALCAAAPAWAAMSSFVVDAETGKVFHQRRADTRRPPASLTKMMTLYLMFEALDEGRLTLKQKLRVSRRAARQRPSRLGLRARQRISVRHVILAMITKSANDAAVVAAEALAGTESKFARVMTRKARALGMKRTTFRNASGLPKRNQRSTARDMATLVRALLRDFPHYYPLFSTARFTYKGRTYRNHNRLLGKYRGMDGLKTGYTRRAKFGLAASAVRGGRRLIAVVLGARSSRGRDRRVAALLDQTYRGLVTETAAAPAARPGPRAVVQAAEDGAKDGGGPDEAAGSADPAADAAEPTAPARTRAPGRRSAAPTAAPAELASLDAAKAGWGIQVGAFRTYRAARNLADRAARKLSPRFRTARVKVTTTGNKRRRLYRARLYGLNRAEARRACGMLGRRRMDCLVFMRR